MSITVDRPPREDVFRAAASAIEIGAGADDTTDTANRLSGHFAVFNVPTEIDSYWEGRFIERIAPGAFTKTFREQRDQIRVLLQHGYDPEVGDKPIATIADLREDEVGAYYEVDLLDGVPPLMVAGLRAGQYGASFRFRVVREEFVKDPGTSDDNPLGLPERTIKEVQLREFGPVTWGAYPDATAEMEAVGEGMRSVTDEWVIERLTRDPERLRRMVTERTTRMAAEAEAMTELQAAVDAAKTSAPSEEEPESRANSAPEGDEPERRVGPVEAPAVKATPTTVSDYLTNRKEKPTWLL